MVAHESESDESIQDDEKPNVCPIWERQMSQMRRPFLDETLMTASDPPSCRGQDFETPRLRKFPGEFSDLVSVDCIITENDLQAGMMDGGIDGYNWKAAFNGNEGPFVMKLFWEQEPEPPDYFAAQRECQNAAVLQQMQEALSPQNASRGPILIFPGPRNQAESRYNYFAFCDEQREAQKKYPEKEPFWQEVTAMPRFRQCYGWLTVRGEDLTSRIPRSLLPWHIRIGKTDRILTHDGVYTAIIYEFIEAGDNVAETVQESIDFLEGAGFSRTLSPRSVNWTNSILLDMSDFVHAWGYGWRYESKLDAVELLRH